MDFDFLNNVLYSRRTFWVKKNFLTIFKRINFLNAFVKIPLCSGNGSLKCFVESTFTQQLLNGVWDKGFKFQQNFKVFPSNFEQLVLETWLFNLRRSQV